MNLWLRAGLGGLASGMRTFTGLAGLVLTTPRRPAHQPDATLARVPVRLLVGLLAGQELVMDKLPQTPDRRTPVAVAGRLIAGALTGAGLAARFGGSTRSGEVTGHPVLDDSGAPASSLLPAAGFGAAAAVVTSLLGPVYRAGLADLFDTDAPGATVEDLAAVALAFAAAWPDHGAPAAD